MVAGVQDSGVRLKARSLRATPAGSLTCDFLEPDWKKVATFFQLAAIWSRLAFQTGPTWKHGASLARGPNPQTVAERVADPRQRTAAPGAAREA